jgi:hypothetical protein
VPLCRIAFLVLATAAGSGLLFAALIALKLHYPRWFGAGHGLLALSGLGVLAYAASQSPDAVIARVWWALALFASVALGGVTLFRGLFPSRRPPLLVLLHGDLAAAGLFLLYPHAF